MAPPMHDTPANYSAAPQVCPVAVSPRSGPPRSALALTVRERQVLALRTAGRSVVEIASALVVEPRTVRAKVVQDPLQFLIPLSESSYRESYER